MLTEQENTKMLEILELIAKKVGVPLNDPTVEHRNSYARFCTNK